jgi:Protein of unknown function
MANQDRYNPAGPRREPVTVVQTTPPRPVVHPHRRGRLGAARRGERFGDSRYLLAYRRLLARHKRLIRRVAIGCAVLVVAPLLVFLGLWWRLSSGPIQIDVVTPWLASAIQDNFGSHDRVEIGGTQIEGTESGGAAVRIRDIVVRDANGAVVAKAPKAEVHISALGLLTGHVHAVSLNLVGAELNVRIDHDGEVTVFAGADKHPIATATVPVVVASAAEEPNLTLPGRSASDHPGALTAPHTKPSAGAAPAQLHKTSDVLAALLTWIDGIGEVGLDGHDLRELGLKEGTLTVDDERSGKDWSLANIRLSLERPRGGGVVVRLGAENAKKPWGLVAAIKPIHDGMRSVEIEAHQVPARGLLRALHLGDGNVETTLPLSASVHAEIGTDGVPRNLTGRIIAGAGYFNDVRDPSGRVQLDHAEFKFNWDFAQRLLSVPFQIVSGPNRLTLLGEVEVPSQPGAEWYFKIGGGSALLATPGDANDPLVLNRIAVTGSFDPTKKRLVVDEGDFGNADVSVFMSGNVDYSGGDLRMNAGFAGKRMSVENLKRLWPVFVDPKVRIWFDQHLMSGTLDHITIAVNAPLETMREGGPPVPDNGLSLDAWATDCVILPVDGLPALNGADLTIHIVGRDAKVMLGKAIADLPSGHKLMVSSGLFEVPDTWPHDPPAQVHFKLDGPVRSAAELLAMDRLREVAHAPFDPATVRGTMTAQVSLATLLKPNLPPGSTNYSIAVDASNFSADNMIMGQRLDATALRVTANPQGFQFKGDVRIAGAPATLEYSQARGDSEADVRLRGTLDAAARHSLGLDPGDTITGAVPIRLSGRIGTGSDHDGNFSIAADLTSARINGFLPGWVKPAGKPARVMLTLIEKPQSIQIDDLSIEGAGGDNVKGAIQLDGSGQLQSANFQSYGFSDGDKASLTADRTSDGALHVIMRGEVYDGRGFIKTLTGGTGGPAEARGAKEQAPDIDLDVKLGAVLAFNGEALSDVDLKMSRRSGEIRSLGLSAKIGRDSMLKGELHSEADGRQVVLLRTADAGALFRATDVYKRMNGGQMLLTMDAPSARHPVQQGTLNVHEFTIHDETQLQRAVTGGASGSQMPAQQVSNDLLFSSMRVDFTRAPGRIALRDGVVRGPMLGGTIDGLIDYTGDSVDLRGTLVPLYGPNNLLGWLPVVGPILGGTKEGLVGFTYQVVGRPGNPVLDVNFLSVLAPGVLRRIFEFPAASSNNPIANDHYPVANDSSAASDNDPPANAAANDPDH